jgi:aminoglycoside phosphotransferase
MNTVLTYLEANRQRLDLARYGVPERLSSVVVTPRFRASSHVVFLVLAPGKPEPLLVAKLPRLGGSSASVEREVANLRAVQTGRAGGFHSIPRVVAFEEYRGRPILVETALVGNPMDPAAVRRDQDQCCTMVVSWLAELPRPARRADSAVPVTAASRLTHSTNAEQAVAGLDIQQAGSEHMISWFSRLVEQPLRHFECVFPLSVEEQRLLERTWELIAPLRDADLPSVFEHGDLSHPNIMLLRNGEPGVVDWELAEPRGLPTYDLFFFLTYIAFASHNARKGDEHLAAFHTAFFGHAAWARPYVAAYAGRLRLPPHTLTPLFVLCWARYMTSLLQRLDAAPASGRLGRETADWLRANRYYALWRHAVLNARGLDWRDLPAPKSRS